MAATPVAAESGTTIAQSSWAYTDVVRPWGTFTGGDAPVGAWRDERGSYHSSKSYFTFDLSALSGTRILGAELFIPETSANDCTKPRATELWSTDPTERPTWSRQPREHAKLPGPGALDGCLWHRVEWDAAAPVSDTLAAGNTRMTLVLRMAGHKQFDPAYGRHYADMHITIRYNRPPDTPTDLRFGFFRPCTPEPMFLANPSLELNATITDPDQDHGRMTATFAIWPVDEPARRTELATTGFDGSRVAVFVPDGVLAEDQTYDWAVRASDDFDSSAWSPPCRFTLDRTRPNIEPTITSPDYPENSGFPGTGGSGIPGQFTFTANGVADVAGFRYGAFSPIEFVPADQLGGSATIQHAPGASGPQNLAVVSVDRAGNQSPIRNYRFWVRATEPRITETDTEDRLGFPKGFHFAPRLAGVVEYTYQLNDGPETTVPAAEDGTADVTVQLTQLDFNELQVWSRTRDGIRSGTARHSFLVSPVYPDVSHTPENGLVGTPFEFTFRPTLPEVVSYVYSFESVSEETVPAAEDGTATVIITPTSSGSNILQVSSISRDGSRSVDNTYVFLVDSGAPTVASEQYPERQYGGGVGVPGTFVFTARLPDTVEFVYSFDFGEEITVPAGPDGTATITITPDQPDWHTIIVRGRTADGTPTEERFYEFAVHPQPRPSP